jgi:hypothetical protein
VGKGLTEDATAQQLAVDHWIEAVIASCYYFFFYDFIYRKRTIIQGGKKA